MLVYGKYDENKQPTLYGTMANVPSADDEAIKYVDGTDTEVEFEPEWLTKGMLVDAGNGRFNVVENGTVIHANVAMVVVTPGVDANGDGDFKDEEDVAPEDTVVTPIDVTEDAGAGEGEDTGDGGDLD